ncbi:MAG TPA: NAD(P)/FAD-dependent oxidoreductase [Gemmatimonadaceae bacterium]|nr:NAD(P)/FAD-dependent oxidoreductase [Gemmatimonadaceae bacterium]
MARAAQHNTTAIVVGSGPNGLAAAITLAHHGWQVEVREGAPVAGGGARSAELTIPGFVHDVCSAVYPFARLSPFFRAYPLEAHGLSLIYPPAALAHPFDDGTAALLLNSVSETAALLGADGHRYRSLLQPLVEQWRPLFDETLSLPRIPRHPLLLARFGVRALPSAATLANAVFSRPHTRALLLGMAAHSMIPLTWAGSAAIALMLAAAAHADGWPIPRGGAGSVSSAMSACLAASGGRIRTASPVESLDDLPPSGAVLLDLTPRQVVRIAGTRLTPSFARALTRYRYGPGAFKVDWALDGPVPWRASDCARAATVHVGGSAEEIIASEAAPWRGQHAERPFVLLCQPSVFDGTRAPSGKHTLWGYCHVPNGSTVDMTARIEAQIERFAPGFRERIIARRAAGPHELEAMNPNLVGGDIGGGANSLAQLLFRPTIRWNPHRTSAAGVYLCSSATPPGGGVHGMCGWNAARTALRDAARSR